MWPPFLHHHRRQAVATPRVNRQPEPHIATTSVTPKTRSSIRRAVQDAPISPPPSRRRPAAATSPKVVTREPEPHIATTSPPVTPKSRSSIRRAVRDSPDNPFLAGPSNSSANPSPHGPLQERPTIAYVFRGVRRECKNPFYNHAQDRPFSPPPESKLPFDHPDYSPAAHCTPKRLFADARSKRKKPTAAKQDTLSRKRARQRSPSLSDDEGEIRETLFRKRARQRSPSLGGDESDVGEIHPLKLDFGPEKRSGAQMLDQELKDAGESVSL